MIRDRILPIFLGVGVMFGACSCALALTVEDGGLAEINGNVSSVVYGDRSFNPFKDNSCKLIGEKIALSDKSTVATYFLTTADACGWGAALGPIWLVKTSHGVASIVLSTGGYSVDALRDGNDGMHDVKIGSDEAGRSASAIYRFDGEIYKRANGGEIVN